MSKIQKLSNLVTGKLGQRVLLAQKHSPVILFAAGVVGVVATVVLASKATLKVEDIILDQDEDLAKIDNAIIHHGGGKIPAYTEKDASKDKALVYARTAGKLTKLYAPAVGVGLLSIAALTGSHYILTTRNTALMAAYAAVQKGFREYRKRVSDELGEDKDRHFLHGTERKQVQVGEDSDGPILVTETFVDPNKLSPYAKIFDEYNNNYCKEPEYNRAFLQAVQAHMNQRLQAHGWLLLNDVYEALGFPRTRAGCVVGWAKGRGDDFVDFGIFNTKSERARAFVNGNEAAIVLDFNVDGVVYDLIGGGCE